MPDQHGPTPLNTLSSTGSTSSGGLAERFKQNPLGVVGTALLSFIEGSEGRPISAVKNAADESKREFERRRLAVLESGLELRQEEGTRAEAREGRAEKKATADAEAAARKATKDDIIFRSTVAKSFVDAPTQAERDRILDDIARAAKDTGSEGLASLREGLRAVGESPPDMSALGTMLERMTLLSQ